MPTTFTFDVTTPAQSTDITPPNSNTAYNGTDILFTGILPLNPKGDYTLVTGDENLRRAILRRLVVKPGEYKKNPTYGCGLPSFVKKAMSQSALDSLRHRIIDNLSRDRRVEKIISVTLTKTTFDNQTGLSVAVVVQSKGRTIPFQPFNFAKGL